MTRRTLIAKEDEDNNKKKAQVWRVEVIACVMRLSTRTILSLTEGHGLVYIQKHTSGGSESVSYTQTCL